MDGQKVFAWRRGGAGTIGGKAQRPGLLALFWGPGHQFVGRLRLSEEGEAKGEKIVPSPKKRDVQEQKVVTDDEKREAPCRGEKGTEKGAQRIGGKTEKRKFGRETNADAR